jgi:hypothetical protein
MTAGLPTTTQHSKDGFPYCAPDNAYQVPADMSRVYGNPSNWDPPSAFAVSSMPATHGNFNPNMDFQPGQSNPRNNNRSHDMMTADMQHAYTDCVSRPGSTLTINTAQQYPAPSVFTPTNALIDAQPVATISPVQTRFDPDNTAAMTNVHYPFGRQFHFPSTSDDMPFSDETFKRRRDSLQTALEDPSPTTSQSSSARRRRSEYAEPGSARAVYLEKNRKAASKCRSKQKREQEELVETARDVERRNRALKAEVDFLRGGLRELMEIVAQHSTCPDTRLRTYVQREADRLASDGRRSTQISHHSRKSSSSGSCGQE